MKLQNNYLKIPIDIYKRGVLIFIGSIEDCAELNEYIDYNFYYVHELQHALRLCGIEKEIVL